MFMNQAEEPKFHRLMRHRHFEQAMELWVMNQSMAAAIWKLTWHSEWPLAVDIVSFLSQEEGFGQALEDWITDADLPVNRVWVTTPEILGRRLAYTPAWLRVYDPFPEHALMYGSKGRTITHESQFGF